MGKSQDFAETLSWRSGFVRCSKHKIFLILQSSYLIPV